MLITAAMSGTVAINRVTTIAQHSEVSLRAYFDPTVCIGEDCKMKINSILVIFALLTG